MDAKMRRAAPFPDLKKEADRLACRGKVEPPPIPCLGHWSHTVDGSDFDCEYPHAGKFGCEDCIVNNGRYDPRTGKRYRK